MLQAIRQVVDVKRLRAFLDIPREMRHGQVEGIVIPLNKTSLKKSKIDEKLLNKLHGSLQKYANPSLISSEKSNNKHAIAQNIKNIQKNAKVS